MERIIKSSVYTYKGKENGFNFWNDLRASNKIRFINNVTELLVNDNYYAVLRDIIFNYQIICVFTDIDMSEIEQSANVIDTIENFLDETNIVTIVKENIRDGLLEELNKAIDDNIEFRTGVHRNGFIGVLTELLKVAEQKLSSIDIESMVSAARAISGISGDLTPEKMIEAYANTDIYTKGLEEKQKISASEMPIEYTQKIDKIINEQPDGELKRTENSES